MPDRSADPERPRAEAPFDRATGFSGQDYRLGDEEALGSRPNEHAAAQAEMPPDNGRHAGADPRTGEVHGSGIGAGGGQPGEDFSSDAATGDGYPLTGGEGADKRPGNLGPPQTPENATPLG